MEQLLRGFYTAATGMIAQQRRTEMLTNNMSNVNTPGFKADQSSNRAFPEMLISRVNSTKVPTKSGLNLPTNSYVGALNTGVYVQETIPAFKQGDLRDTNNTTDLALVDIVMPLNEENGKSGSVFFTVRHEDQIGYTRSGNFTLDHQNYLTTVSGHYVLNNEGQPIQVNSDQFQVNEQGEVFENNILIDQIGIAFAENPYILTKQANGLYYANDGNVLPILNNNNGEVQFSIKQGMLEGSNVDAARTMTDMLAAYRSFEANQKVLQAYDKSMEKAVNEIGRL